MKPVIFGSITATILGLLLIFYGYFLGMREINYLKKELETCTEYLQNSMNMFEELLKLKELTREQYENKLNILDQITVDTNMDSGQFLAWFKLYAESFDFHVCID
jgi:hypothetical protein